MYNKIIVPLDGSVLAEKALPYATNLTKHLNATLVLVRVAETKPQTVGFSEASQYEAGNLIHAGNLRPNRPQATWSETPPADSSGQYQTFTSYTGGQSEEDYLEEVKGKLLASGAESSLKAEQIQTHVILGRSPKELAAIVEEEQADLVVMSTHGRSGLSLLLAGSVATNLIHHSVVPLILLKPDETAGTEQDAIPAINFNLDPIVVALDGTPGSETVLEAAVTLAQQLGVKIHLFEVVSSLMPADISGVGGFYYPVDYNLDKETANLKVEATQYFKEIQTRLKEKGVESIAVVQTGEPTIPLEYNGEPITRIIDYARKVKAQLVAMTTHSRGQVGQFVLGSVAEAVVRESHLPVLLMRK